MRRSRELKKEPQGKQAGRQRPRPKVQPAEALGTTAAAQIRTVHERVNALIRAHGGGVSVPHSAAFHSLWSESAKYSQNLLENFTIHLDALEAKNYYFLDREAMPGSLSRAMSEYEYLKNKPFSGGEIKAIEEKYHDDPWLDSYFVCAFTSEFLKSDYEPPANNVTGMQAHLQHINWCYNYCLPYMDKIYPVVNMKLDSAFVRLSNVATAFICAIQSKGKLRDQRKNAGDARTIIANEVKAAAKELIPLIAQEKNRDVKSELKKQAIAIMKNKYKELHPDAKDAPEYTKTLENLVSGWKRAPSRRSAGPR